MNQSTHRSYLLTVGAGALGAVLTLGITAAFAPSRVASGKIQVEEIDVERINVREPDGTLRLVLSSRARFPGLHKHGTEYEHPNRSTAGLLFLNDEGTEQGGLIFGGQKKPDGSVDAFNHLSFDQYDQDQVLYLSTADSDGLHKAGISVWDRPDWSSEELVKLFDEMKGKPDSLRRAALDAFFEGREEAHPRMYIGKSQSGAVSVRMNDPQGRERLILEVAPDGTPALRMLDESGDETARFPAE